MKCSHMLKTKVTQVNLKIVQPPSMQSAKPAEEEAFEREKTVIVCCPNASLERPDKVLVVDVDPTRDTYGKVISSVEMPSIGDEVDRAGWLRTCASVEQLKGFKRNFLVVPCINSSRIYVLQYENERIYLHRCIDEDVLLQKDLSAPFSVHSLPERGTPLFISTLGSKQEYGRGDFVTLDRKTLEVRERAESDDEHASFGGSFAVQPRFEYMISTEWGHPRLFKHGLVLSDLQNGSYGHRLNVWRIQPRRLKQVVELDSVEGCMTRAVRFLHNKEVNHGFACSAYGSTIFHIHPNAVWIKRDGRIRVDKVVTMEAIAVEGWMSEQMPAMIADLVISLDDRFMYVSAWLHGYIAQFDIKDPFRVSLCCKVYIGGAFHPSSGVRMRSPSVSHCLPQQLNVDCSKVRGGPSTLQLSLDGRRLYVTTSFYRAWDAQFYPELLSEGATMVMIDVIPRETGGMVINSDFLVDFGAVEGGPYLARGIRLNGGDCTSESFV